MRYAELVPQNVLGLAVDLSLLAAFAICLRWLRTRVYEQHVFARYGWLRKATTWIEDRVEYLFVGSLAFGTLAVMALAAWFLGAGFATDAILLAMVVLAFVSFQLPRLFPPHVFVTAMRSSDGDAFTGASAVKDLILSCGEEHVVAFQVTNLGINHCKALGCWIGFSKAISPVIDQKCYSTIDFAKKFTYQKGNKVVYFNPSDNFQDITPANHLLFPVIIRANSPSDNEWITVEVACDTRWRSTTKRLSVRVTGN